MPVTAISGETLIDSNRLGLQEYSTAIPGLSVTPRIQSGLNLSIRGITTGGFSNPTVGVTVDDVPYGASTALGGGLVVPDMDPGDLARVEVLRGPQGTLYGASSMGGLLKFVTIDPSFERFSGRVQAGVHSVHNGDGLGYNARGSVNLPLSDTSALRASAFRRVDPGYIDNPVLAIDGINEQRVGGGQLSVFWQPSDAFSMKLGALIQETKGDGLPDVTVQPGLDDLQQSYVRGAGAYDRETQALSATLTWELGDVDLTSVSGYNINSFSDSWDFSDVLGGFFEATFAVAGAPVYNDNKARKLTQEIRLSAPLGERAEWLLGAFYTDEDSDYEQNILAVDPVTGRVAGQALNISFPSSFKEYAIFGNVTIDVTEQFDVQFGARQSEIEQSHSQFQSGPLIGPAPVVDPKLSAETDALTFLVTPRFKISPDVMLYARVASGYRAGGPNLSPGGVVPSQYEPDKTKNYDIGLKGSFIGDSLSIDASLYHIDWEDIQLFAVNPQTQYGYNFNGSQARSQGAELSIESRPLEGLAIAAWVVWSDAELTQDLPSRSAFGLSGDSLPNSSRFSGSFSLEQEFTLVNELRASVGGSVSYIGDRKGVFTASPQRQKFPSYTKIDLRAGIKHGSWTLNVFANNVADKRGVISGGLGQFPPFAFQYIQPRTIGLSLAKNF